MIADTKLQADVLTCVADPKEWPKSIPTEQPVSRSIIKLDKCRSPMPSMYWQIQSRECEMAKFVRSVKKASVDADMFR